MVPDNTSDNDIDDAVLNGYLLGTIPEEERERLDRLSITEEGLAWRIRALEDDLVDAYVRGELSEEQAPRFRETYLSSPVRRRKVAIAEALLAREARSPATTTPARTMIGRHWRAWAVAAAIAVAVPAAYLFVVPRVEEKSLVVQSAPTPQPAPAVTKTVQPAPDVAQAPAAPSVAAPAGPRAISSVSFLLAAPTRAVGAIEELRIASDVDRVALRLELEFDDFERYRGELRDLQSGAVVWRGDGVTMRKNAESTIAFELPRVELDTRRYAMELYGINSGAPKELIASYPFRVNTNPTR